MYSNFEFVGKFKFIKCTISWKFNRKLCTLDIQMGWSHGKIQIRQTYDIVKILWKTVYIRCTESPNSGKNWICWIYKIAKIQRKIEYIRWKKFEFIECTILWKFNGNSCTMDVQTVWIHGKIRLCWKYDIEKIQCKIVYTRCTESPKLRKIRICGMYDIVKIQWKIPYIRCIESSNLMKKSNSLNVGYCEN